MNIDIRTLVLVACIANVLQMMALFLQFRVNNAYAGGGWWLLNAAAMMIAYLLLLLRDLVSIQLITIILANFLFILGGIFMYPSVPM